VRSDLINHPPTIGIVDDDSATRRALRRLLMAENFQVQCWASAEELLANLPLSQTDRLILDIEMPGTSGLDLQDQLATGACQLPVVFLTGTGDIPMTVRAMKAGAVNFLTKTVMDGDLLAAINARAGNCGQDQVRPRKVRHPDSPRA